MKKFKTVLILFLTMAKIGLFTFGGGYAMIAIIERELVEKKKWIDKKEYLDVIAIAESSPGPIAVNTATFVGYKIGGFFGSLFATIGVVLPSFTIILIISFFYEQFVALEYVGYAFKGIQACVAFLILSAGVKMSKALEKTPFNIIMVILTVASLLTLDLLAVNVSTILYILGGAIVGLTLFLIKYFKQRTKGKDDKGGNSNA